MSIGPTQKQCIECVKHFLKRNDTYNALEALKAVEEPAHSALLKAIQEKQAALGE